MDLFPYNYHYHIQSHTIYNYLDVLVRIKLVYNLNKDL